MPSRKDEIAYWEKRAAELRRTELERVRGTASKWQATLSALLGLFGAVAFVGGGADTIRELRVSWLRLPAAIAVLIALLLAVASSIVAAYAAQGVPADHPLITGTSLRQTSRSQARRSKRLLFHARWMGLSAAAIVLLGSATVFSVSAMTEPATETQQALLMIGRETACGELSRTNGVISVGGLSLDGQPVLFELVDECP